MGYLKIITKSEMNSKRWLLLLLLPILIGLFWGGYQKTVNQHQTKYAIGLVDLDQTNQSRELLKRLKEHPSLDVVIYNSGEDAEKGLIQKYILQSYIIEDGFESSLLEGDYRNIVEVVSMIKSPYSDWLNDQISVGVIREWLISDGYLRLKKLSPEYKYEEYEEAFRSYYDNNELLAFSVIQITNDTIRLKNNEVSKDKGFLWLWIAYCLGVMLVLLRVLHREWHGEIWKRLYLSGVKRHYYVLRFIIKILCIGILSSGLSLMATKVVGVSIGIQYLELISGIILMLLILFFIGNYLVYLPLNTNQFTIVYTGVFIVLCLLSSEYITIFPFGKWLHYLSPMTLFFKICL